MIDLYYWPTPNGWKISIALEEIYLDYRVVPVNIGRGEQFEPALRRAGTMDEQTKKILFDQTAKSLGGS